MCVCVCVFPVCVRTCMRVYSFVDAVCDLHGYVSSSTYWSCTDLELILCGFSSTIYDVT